MEYVRFIHVQMYFFDAVLGDRYTISHINYNHNVVHF